MTTYNLYGTAVGTESVYDYTRRRWSELINGPQDGSGRRVTNDANGAYAASHLIFTEIKKNPSIVTDTLPPDASYLEAYINNPSNPLTWISQKTGQAANSLSHSVAVNLDKPAELLQSVGNALPWYVKPGAVVGILAASIILPPLFGSSIQGIIRGLKGKARKGMRSFR